MKRFHIQRYEIVLLLLILLATLARLLLITQNWPITNSDEGNMGLLARHVAFNGAWPIFFYGLPYLGPIEGYVAAPLFHIFGPSTFTLRLGLLPFFFLFVICMYYLTRLLYTRGLAIFTVVLLCLGSDEVIGRQLKAVGEYPEIIFFAAAICLILVWLACSRPTVLPSDSPGGQNFRRILVYGLLGLLVGLALWDDFLILPFLGTGTLFLLFFCGRELWSWRGLSLFAGFVIGAFPLIWYNITAPLTENSISVLVGIDRDGANLHLPFLQQIVGTFFIGIPNATGYNPLCADVAFPYFNGHSGPLSSSCIVFQGGWSAVYLLLLALAAIVVARFIWLHWRGRSLRQAAWSFEERRTMIYQCGRLMLLVSAAGTIVLYAVSPKAAVAPDPTSRYLVCLLVALPAVLWPLWKGLTTVLTVSDWRNRTLSLLGGSVLVLVFVVYGIGTIRTFQDIPAAQAYYQQQDALVQKLLQLDATRIYSEYWTCNRLIFQSQEQIICSALDGQLNPGFDRYIPYRTIVRNSPHPAYVFPVGSPQVRTLDARMKSGKIASTYRRLVFENYVIYLPG